MYIFDREERGPSNVLVVVVVLIVLVVETLRIKTVFKSLCPVSTNVH